MSKPLHRVRVTHEVASTRHDLQGVHNVLLLDKSGKPQRDSRGADRVLTFSSVSVYLRGKLPPEIADNPYLLVDQVAERDMAREPGEVIDLAPEAPAQDEPEVAASGESAVEPDAAPPEAAAPAEESTAPPAAEAAKPAPSEPEPDPVTFTPSPQLMERVASGELATLTWAELQRRANVAGVKSFGLKRPDLEQAILAAEAGTR